MSGLYLHIPFCDTKCIYCDFYSITNRSKKKEFIEALISEIEFYKGKAKDLIFDTIFFGGGTPSLLDISDFEKLFEALYKTFKISPKTEITIEANPGTLDKNKINDLKKLPINRLSFGVQSFIENDLKFLSRIHSSKDAVNAVKFAQDAGYNNINVDLIFALPGQTSVNWKYNLNKAIELNTQHISAYNLIFEEGTPLFSLEQIGKVEKAKEELEAEMYDYTMNFLSDNGYEQYEISNFAKPGYECKHNLKYWTHKEYLSFGPSAASFFDNKRFVNLRNLEKYIKQINSGQFAYEMTEDIDEVTSRNEYIFLGLRSKGIDLKDFRENYRMDFYLRYRNKVDELLKHKFAYMDGDMFKLTRIGYSVCDEISSGFM